MLFDNKIINDDMNNIYARNINWQMLDNKAVLITGAYGMLASYVVYFLCFINEIKGINVKVIAQGRSTDKARQRFNDFWDKEYFEFITDNITEDISIEGNVDYIIHAAGGAYPGMYSKIPVEVIEPNVIGTYNLLKLAVEKSTKSFLYFSSGDVYGKTDDPSNITEETVGRVDPLDAHSCYSESKRMAETMCVSFYREYGIPTKMARIGHTYGPTMDIDNDPRVFASFLKNAIEHKDIVMLSDGSAKRAFCYLADAVAAYMTILLKGANGEAYNVCNTDEFLSIKEFANIVANLDENRPLTVHCKERDINDGYVDNKDNKDNKPISDKLKGLGFEFKYDTYQGMKRTYEYKK